MSNFEEKINELKKPRELGHFSTESIRDLDQAIEILTALRKDAARNDKDVAWDKLNNAKLYLDKLLKEDLARPE